MPEQRHSTKNAPAPPFRRELRLTTAGLALTCLAYLAFLTTVGLQIADRLARPLDVAEAGIYVVLVSLLVYGGLTYQLARLGYLRRRAEHRSSPGSSDWRRFGGDAPRVVALVPSYREEAEVVRQTLLSAALQDYPHRRVVLLIDDPPDPGCPDDATTLDAARALPHEVADLLAEPRALCTRAAASFERWTARRAGASTLDLSEEAHRLAAVYDEVAGWFDEQAERHPHASHTDELFVREVLRAPAEAHRQTAEELRQSSHGFRVADLSAHCRHLRWLFSAEVTSFERKRYSNLSQAANKAMNLNSYIDLLGGRYAEREARGGLTLEETGRRAPGLDVPDADYVLTLDADSVLLPDYAARLVDVMEESGNERVAVSQTPYSAVPGSPGVLERVAGATTDMQYIVHQGFTRHEATFWVGANALLRKAALDDIRAVEPDADGRTSAKYIQDRTVIEDTESSVDLAERGWRLFNYPEHLSYSATPPDYGALVIQRRRWANGGLIILPKLLRHLWRKPWRKLGEGWMRVHYLISIASANLAFVALLLFPFDDWLATVWLPLTALPYFALYSRDLRQHGYPRWELLRVYALNVLLVAANLGGVLKSVHQAVTGRQTPFKRTPKTSGRTAVPALYLAVPYLAVAYLSLGVFWDLAAGRLSHAALALVNGLLLGYAIARFIGADASREDLFSPLLRLRWARPLLGRVQALTQVVGGSTLGVMLVLVAASALGVGLAAMA